MSVFKSIEEFAKYVETEFLAPPFYITKIIPTGHTHPTNYAEVKYEAMIEGEGIIPSKEVEVRYQMAKDKLRDASIDKFSTPIFGFDFDWEELEREWWDTNHLYYNGGSVITYIHHKGTRNNAYVALQFWSLNISEIGDWSSRHDDRVNLWLNKYNTTLKQYLLANPPTMYKIPIKKAPVIGEFMNWKDSPLKEN